jgi:hypothetical protein
MLKAKFLKVKAIYLLVFGEDYSLSLMIKHQWFIIIIIINLFLREGLTLWLRPAWNLPHSLRWPQSYSPPALVFQVLEL